MATNRCRVLLYVAGCPRERPADSHGQCAVKNFELSVFVAPKLNVWALNLSSVLTAYDLCAIFLTAVIPVIADANSHNAAGTGTTVAIGDWRRVNSVMPSGTSI